MSFTAGDVYTEARALLNDTAASRYSDAQLLPLVKRAYDELQNLLVLFGAAPVIADGIVAVVIGQSQIVIGIGGLATDTMEPFYLEERTTGSSEFFTPMRPVQIHAVPSTTSPILEQWTWQGNKIQLRSNGATTNRDIHVWYFKALTTIASGATAVELLNAKSYLAAKSAAFVAAFIDGDIGRAEILNDLAQTSQEVLLGTEVKRQQATPVKRMPFGFRRRLMSKRRVE